MLIAVRLVASGRRLWDWVQTACRHPSFVWPALILWWRQRNPYAVSREFHKQRGEDPYQYGETLLTTLSRVVKRFGIKEGARVYELGCGPGRTAWWLHLVARCEVVGIEQVPEFVQKAPQSPGLEIREGDFLTTDYSDADWVYLYGTNLEDHVIRRLIGAFASLREGAKVITVSYPLTDYAPEAFTLVDEMEALFPWGRASIYLQSKT